MSDEQPITPQNDQPDREWIPVSPPNPYSAEGPGAGGAGRGLAIAAMAVGLVALLTAGVSAFYFSLFIVLAAVLGLVAVALGIVALVKRRLRPAAVTGLVAGALAVCIAVGVGGLALGAVLSQGALSSDEGSGSGEARDWSAEEQSENLIEWPANMGTGGILFVAGSDGPVPARSEPLAAGTAPEAPATDREDGPADILLYVDYRCPHCVDFEAANAQTLERLVSEGRATLEIRPMAFVQPFSTRLSGAMACMVDAQPDSAWAAHLALLSRETQQVDDTAGLVSALDEATGGLDADARSCVESDRFAVFADALSEWYVGAPVPNAVDPQLQVRGTPLAVVNGVAYTGSPEDGAAFLAFLEEQGL